MVNNEMISGVISAVIFKNDENGYSVLKLATADGGEAFAVGCVPFPGVGEYIEASGIWQEHASYGMQFKIISFNRTLPNTADMILEYLSSGTIRGIGRKTAEKIVGMFGDDSLYIIERKPKRLCEIAGITALKAEQIAKQFEMQNALSLLMSFIKENGLSAETAVAIFRVYGLKSMETILRNPYVLATENIGVPFYAADEIAIRMGFDGDAAERISAAIIYELQYNSESGHSFIPREKLCAATSQLINIDYDEINAEISRLEKDGEIVIEDICNVTACYLKGLYNDETYVAKKLADIANSEKETDFDCDELIEKAEENAKIKFEPLQKNAIEAAVNNKVLLLTGGPGTGKTTVIKGMIFAFEKIGLRVLLAAPTGRAAKRMSEFCGTEAKTIHRLLEISFEENGFEAKFSRDEHNPLEADVLIVDETSMVDISLMAAMLNALPKNCKLILVGDADQLPSVGPGNVFKDMLNSKMFTTVCLDRIFRQAAESDIVINAHSINRGELPDFKKRDNDMFFMQRSDETELVQTVLDLCRTRLPKHMNIPSTQIQVLAVSRKGQSGTYELNKALQHELNPPAEGKDEHRFGDKLFRLGDRVMQIKNNYNINWFGMYGGEVGCGVFNGDIGEVIAIDDRDETMTVNFDNKLVHYPFTSLNELELAYAMTVHKSQGSEFRAVVLALGDSASPVLFHRSILYTAVTRARELLITVGNLNIVKKMVDNNKQRNRYSALRARIVKLLK